MSVATEKQPSIARSRAHVPGEIEARYLLVVGIAPDDVADITGLRDATTRKLAHEIADFGDGPYTAGRDGDIAGMLGISYRAVYHLMESGELGSRGGGAEEYSITKQALKHMVNERLRKDGARKARYMLFIGKSPGLAAIRGRMPEKKAEALAKQLAKAGAGPDDLGPFTVEQASAVLGLKERQVRGYCQQGRFGTLPKFGQQYQIPREALIEFGAKDRRYGCQAARWEED